MEMIAKTDVITINDEEARQLSGEYSLVKAAKKSTKWDRSCDHQKRRTRSFSMIIKYLQFLLYR
jgi:sugar/nucleoside kinase (ribokinase family)